MPNIIIPVEHQAAPKQRYDGGLARAAAELKDSKESQKRDWDEFDYRCLNPQIAKRRKMQNLDFDEEFKAPGHDDAAIAMLRRSENDSSAWVEENLELYESNCMRAKDQRLEDQERWQKEHEASRVVNIMHPSAIMRRLRAAGVDARDEESPHARIWLNDFSRAGLVGVNAWVTPDEMDEEGYLLLLREATSQRQKDLITENYFACRERRKVQRTMTSLQEPYGPEWSVMRFNERGIATKEKFRGWRTAMLVLICAGILTEDEVERAFGPAIGEAGEFYRKTLKLQRQIKIGQAI